MRAYGVNYDTGFRDWRVGLRAQTSQGKPFAVTEFGCTPYRGAADRGSRSGDIVERDEQARPLFGAAGVFWWRRVGGS
jgi:hypothetical protein